jgi:hypothetical protein
MKYILQEILITLSELIDNIERIMRRFFNADNTKDI